MIGYLIAHSGDILAHTFLGVIFAGTGFLVRGACSHRGWLPHPAHQITLTFAIVLVEACITVPLVG
jgi:hypothetical protein